MAKVKKHGAVRGAIGKRTTKTPERGGRVTKVAQKTKLKAQSKPSPPASTFRVRELDPLQKCGAGTSVQRLFRIDESIDGVVKPHLVFLDRHGWYCEHGPDCPAVSHARSA